MGSSMQPPRTSAVSERRAATRQRVAYRLDVLAGDGHSGCLLDISSSGLRVRFKPGVDVGLIERVCIEFPRWLELGASLEVGGRFVWVRKTASGAPEAGFAFGPLSRKVQGVLEVLVQRLSEALSEDQADADPR